MMNAGQTLLEGLDKSTKTINGRTLVQVLISDAKNDHFGINRESSGSWGADEDKL